MLSDYYYVGDGDLYVPARQYQYLRRQKELRRRLEAEQSVRREQELAHRKLAQEKELARRRRREEALEERRRFMVQNDRRQQQKQPFFYKLVRGRDGYLYRMPVMDDEDRILVEKDNFVGSSDNFKSTNRPVEQIKDVRKSKAVKAERKYLRSVESPLETAIPSGNDAGEITINIKLPEKTREMKKAGRRRVTVVVEDASDSESDGDDLKSIWRNRRPSPGEWIEPVEDIP